MHLPIMHIIFPANVVTLYSEMIPTLGFDILDTFLDWEYDQSIITFDFKRHYAMQSQFFS